MIKKYILLDKIIISSAYLYLLIPIVMLLCSWFKLYISIPAIILILLSTYFVYKSYKPKTVEEYAAIFSYKKWIFIIIIIILLNLLSGAGGHFYQNWDYRARNAVLHDLINFNWPVKFSYSNPGDILLLGKNGFLSYYFTYWLPGAFIGKLTNFTIASNFMLIWQTYGTFLFFYLISRYFKKVKISYVIIFLMFSGLDVFGKYVFEAFYKLPHINNMTDRIDIWAGNFGYSSLITQLFWVFNQSLPAWIATILLISQENYKNYGYIAAILLPFSPMPFIGFVFLMFVLIIFGINFVKRQKFFEKIKELFSLQNIFSILSIFPVVILFFTNPNGKVKGIIFDKYGFSTNIIFEYLIFIIFEVLFFILLLRKENKKLLISSLLFLTILPLFYLGLGMDLCNRASIPFLILLYILTLNVYDFYKKDKLKSLTIIFSVFLIFAFITNFKEISRSIDFTMKNKVNNQSNFNDSWLTYSSVSNNESQYYAKNFVSPYDENNWYIKYLIR